jgi:hypothetical protein
MPHSKKELNVNKSKAFFYAVMAAALALFAYSVWVTQ